MSSRKIGHTAIIQWEKDAGIFLQIKGTPQKAYILVMEPCLTL